MHSQVSTLTVSDPASAPPAAATAPAVYRALDHAKEATLARLTGGLSPASMAAAVSDWLIHLSVAPGKQMELAMLGAENARKIAGYLTQVAMARRADELISAPAGDDRFRAPAWQDEPHRFLQQTFLLTESWWNAATRDVPGTTPHHGNVVSFIARQLLDVLSPSNFPLTNPEVVKRAVATSGASLRDGARNLLDDARRLLAGKPAPGLEDFKVGVDLATTPGKVVFSNHLIELIQYSPTTAQVLAEPVLIVPAWIMKYYILDLSPKNSIVRYLVNQGHTVFCISWRNVTAEDRELGLDDYRRLGVMDALDAVSHIVPGEKVHATGYCLGGTLLSIAAAAMASVGDDRLASVTLFAAQTDFSEPGELQLFIDESEVYFLESMMWEKGYLAMNQMAGAFQLLQSNDLIWSRIVRDYLLGLRTPMTDLMAWNADGTRMPYRMHSEYLRGLFLNNDLAAGRYGVDGHPISIRNVHAPMFVVGNEHDHIAPWESVYKIHNLSPADITFVLTNRGHNAGIVCEPGHPNRTFRMKETRAHGLRVGPGEWLAAAPTHDGSWWPAWHAWLSAHSKATPVAARAIALAPKGRPLLDAPGSYVLQT